MGVAATLPELSEWTLQTLARKLRDVYSPDIPSLQLLEGN